MTAEFAKGGWDKSAATWTPSKWKGATSAASTPAPSYWRIGARATKAIHWGFGRLRIFNGTMVDYLHAPFLESESGEGEGSM